MPTEAEITAAVRLIEWELAQVPDDDQVPAMNRAIARLPPELKGSLEVAALMAIKAHKTQTAAANAEARYSMVQGCVAFAFGVLFVIVMLIIAIEMPNPTDFQYFVFRTVLSLALVVWRVSYRGF